MEDRPQEKNDGKIIERDIEKKWEQPILTMQWVL